MKALFPIVVFALVAAYALTRPETGLQDQIWTVQCSNGVFEYAAPHQASNKFEVELCEIFKDPLDI